MHYFFLQCMQPNFLLIGQVYPMLMSNVPMHWAHSTEKVPFDCKIFLMGVVFMFWHDIVYIQLLYCITNFELVWTWNKAVVVENAKKCRQNSTFPILFKTNKCHYGGPPWSREPGAIAPVAPPFNPALYVTFYQINKLSANIWFFQFSWNGFACRVKWFLGPDYKYRIT